MAAQQPVTRPGAPSSGGEAVPLGASGRVEALPLTNAAGDHALLVRQDDASRALLTAERQPERDRVVLVPLDDDVELRMDGDALAVWLATGSVGVASASVPAWASAIGFGLVLLVLGLTILGSLTFFGWLAGLVT
jgi:hypothetical protein